MLLLVFFRAPLICARLWQADVGEDAIDELPGHLLRAPGMVVERGDGREDHSACFCGELHVAQMNAIERSFAHAKNERAAFFEADIRSAMDQITREAIGDGRQRSHGARQYDHCVCGITAAGDAGADVCVAVLAELIAARTEKFFRKAVAAAQLKLFREDPE